MNDPSVLYVFCQFMHDRFLCLFCSLQNAVFQYLVSTKKFSSATELYREANLNQYYATPLEDILQASQWNESNNLLITIWNDYLATHHSDVIPSNSAQTPPVPTPAPVSTQQLNSHNHDINPTRSHSHKTHFHPQSPPCGHDHHHHHSPKQRVYTARTNSPEILNQTVTNLSLNAVPSPPINATPPTTTITDVPAFPTNPTPVMLASPPPETFFQFGVSPPGPLSAALQAIGSPNISIPMGIPDEPEMMDAMSTQDPNNSPTINGSIAPEDVVNVSLFCSSFF